MQEHLVAAGLSGPQPIAPGWTEPVRVEFERILRAAVHPVQIYIVAVQGAAGIRPEESVARKLSQKHVAETER